MRTTLQLGFLFAACVVDCGSKNLCDNDACDAQDGSMNDAGYDAPPPPGCDLTMDPRDSPACVADSVGIFVSPTGLDSNPGTKELPMLTVAGGIGRTGALKRVYVCAGTYPEDLALDATHDGVSIYGGFLCQTWGYQASQQPVIGKSNNSAKISGLTMPVFIEDLAINAADGMNPGDSSVAVLVASCSATVTFARVSLTAGVGQDGAPGSLTSYVYPTQGQLNGNSSAGIDGGSPNTIACPGGDSTTGGQGGYGNGQDGVDGTPGPSDKGTLVACVGTNAGGGNGASGGNGADAPVIPNLGTLTSSAWAPASGTTGVHGSVGQGGGGGAGVGGGGGGGGGCGGCGGNAGGGGGGAGASLALAAFSSDVILTTSTLAASTPGSGGSGLAGQSGETVVGFHGNGTGTACQGGNGGTGGNGGAGAGGAGGISVGILWKGTQPTVDSATTAQITVASQGGTKGTGGNSPMNDGIAGVAMPVLQSP
jgi:hypothetical protein